MSKLNSLSAPRNSLGALARDLHTTIVRGGASIASKDDTQNVMSLESLNQAALESVTYKHNELIGTIKDAFRSHGFAVDDPKNPSAFLPHQWEAGAIALAAAGNPVAYAQRTGLESAHPKLDNLTVFDGSLESGFDFRTEGQLALEAFDDRTLNDNLGFNVMFNVVGSRQDEFGEAWFHSVIVTPDQSGIAISVRKIQVYNEVRHSLSGKPTDFNMLNLLDAQVDASILSNVDTDAIPYFVTGDVENNANFVNVADVAPTNATINGNTFLTAPLRVMTDIDLLGLAQNPGVTSGGQFDSFDALDHRLALGKVYLKITGVSAAATSVIPVSVEGLPRTSYLKSNEGKDREMQLNFTNRDIPLTGVTKDVADAVAPALVYLADPLRANWIVRLKVTVSGQANLMFGTISAIPSNVIIDSVAVDNGDGTFGEITPAEMTALKAEFAAMSIIGFDPIARRSNTNRRTMGLLVNSLEQNEIHTIPLGAPITANNPVTQTKTSTDMTAPVTCARIRNSIGAVTKLLSTASQLSSLKLSNNRRTPVPEIQGIARHVLRPFYEYKSFDALNVVNSIKSQDRSLDLSAAMVNQIREVVYRMYRDSGYQLALDAHTGHNGEKPIVLIGTDPVIARHLIVPGDTRLASIGFETKVVTTMDSRMYGKIFVTITRANQNGADPLSFGLMAWMPELASSLQITRNGSTTIEASVQPRVLHVTTCPLLAEFDVVNLTEAVAGRVNIPFKTVP